MKDDKGNEIGGIRRLEIVTAVNTLMGIPMPTNPTTLELNLENAAEVELLFGSFGWPWEWVSEVSDSGAQLTVAFQYAIPTFFLAAGTNLSSNQELNAIIKDKGLIEILLEVAQDILGGVDSDPYGATDLLSFAFTCADAVPSLLAREALKPLAEWVFKKVGYGAAVNGTGPVGWVL